MMYGSGCGLMQRQYCRISCNYDYVISVLISAYYTLRSIRNCSEALKFHNLVYVNFVKWYKISKLGNVSRKLQA